MTRARPRGPWALAALLAAAATGCLGDITGGIGGGGGGGDDDPPDIDVGGEVDGAEVGGRQLRRLTTREYDNTVRDVFTLGDAWPGSGLSPDTSSSLGFDNDATLLAIEGPRAAELEQVSENIAALVVATRLGSVSACGTRNRACAEAVIDRFAPRLYRRALTSTERDRHLTTFDGLADVSADEALEWTLVGLLNSPYFLYRFEIGAPEGDGVFRLSGEELATSLAYTFSESPPSEALLERGRSGELAGADARLVVARELLESPRGRAMVEHFTQRWLRYDEVRNIAKDESVVPGFVNLRSDMAEETRRFLEHIFYVEKSGVAALFTSNVTFVSPALAQHYGLSAPAGAFGQVTRPPEQALGLLAQGSILSRFALTAISSPPQRGTFVERHLLCRELPPPPPNVGTPPVPLPGQTTRETFELAHSVEPSCASCHRIIDGIGFGLENFDTAGRWRDTEQGKPIVATGQIVGYDANGERPFQDARELTELLGHSPNVARCVGGLMGAYAFGATFASAFPAPERTKSLETGALSLYEYFAQLAAAPHFSTRIERPL